MNCIFFSILFLLVNPLAGNAHADAQSFLEQARLSRRIGTLSQLTERCALLPERTTRYASSAVSMVEFDETILRFKQLMNTRLDYAHWANPADKPSIDFKPFVQKLSLPEGSTVAMWGDLHGSIHSLLRSLNRLRTDGFIDDTFKITKPDFYMFFLGDFVDRGKYGVEVVYTLLRLKLANPDNVFLVCGNHEDAQICAHYGFATELFSKFGLSYNFEPVYALFEYLPMALFLGKQDSTDFVLCCHGGIEPGFNPQQLLTCSQAQCYAWIGVLKRADWVQTLPYVWQQVIKTDYEPEQFANFLPMAPTNPYAIGFLWNDFVDDNSTLFMKPSRNNFALSFGIDGVSHYLKNSQEYSISKIIRAHQHNGQMLLDLIENKGVHSLWNNTVYTLLSAPAMGIQDFAYDSLAMVEVKDGWPITHRVHSIIN